LFRNAYNGRQISLWRCRRRTSNQSLRHHPSGTQL